MTEIPSLEIVLSYKNQNVINRYQKTNSEKSHLAEALFSDMLKYLWLGQKHINEHQMNPQDHELDFLCVMHEEMQDVDQMWHCFILFTQDYLDFCMSYFGKFLHHVPNVAVTRPLSPEEFERELTLFLQYVQKHLGDETLSSWFAVYLNAS